MKTLTLLLVKLKIDCGVDVSESGFIVLLNFEPRVIHKGKFRFENYP
jgi:hypothetical protein